MSTPSYVRDSDYDVFSSVHDINCQVTLLRQYLRDLPISEQILGFDEEHEYGSRAEFPPNGRDKVGLLQIGYASRGGSTKALLLQVRQMQQLPDQLLKLFKDGSITYIGKRVAEISVMLVMTLRFETSLTRCDGKILLNLQRIVM